MYGHLIKQANYQLASRFDRVAAPYGLTGTQLSVIDFLGRQEGMQADQQAIEREFNIRRSSTTMLLQRMVAAELVTRVGDPTDRRKKLVALTPKAQKLVAVAQEAITASEEWLVRDFSDGELATIRKFLNRVIEGRTAND